MFEGRVVIRHLYEKENKSDWLESCLAPSTLLCVPSWSQRILYTLILGVLVPLSFALSYGIELGGFFH